MIAFESQGIRICRSRGKSAVSAVQLWVIILRACGSSCTAFMLRSDCRASRALSALLGAGRGSATIRWMRSTGRAAVQNGEIADHLARHDARVPKDMIVANWPRHRAGHGSICV